MRVAVTSDGHVISATLDDVTEKMAARHDDAQLELPPCVYYGGMDVSANTFGEYCQAVYVCFSDQRTTSCCC